MVHLIELASSSSSTELPLSQNAFPTIEEQIANLPNNIKEAIADITLPKRPTLSYKLFLTILLQKHGEFMKGLRFHPNYPLLNVFHIHDLFRLPKEALVFFCISLRPTPLPYPLILRNWLCHCLAHANRVDPATIPKEIMHELTSWSDNDPVSSHWIQALEEWIRTHVQGRIETSDEDIDIDSDADSGYFPDMNETHFDPYEDDPSHEDSRWK
ncbi:hypothetical protein LXL04_034965 [Taraxacum kok-saghyz]